MNDKGRYQFSKSPPGPWIASLDILPTVWQKDRRRPQFAIEAAIQLLQTFRAVEISVGVSTMASAFSELQPHSLGLYVLILSALTFVNLPDINGKTVRGRVRVDCFPHSTEQTTSF
jgi:hypothetical protein